MCTLLYINTLHTVHRVLTFSSYACIVHELLRLDVNSHQSARSESTLKAVHVLAELAELRSKSSDVYLDAHGLE